MKRDEIDEALAAASAAEMAGREVRVIRWLAPGYEDAFTQYTIVPHGDGSGTLWIVQIALRDNMARRMQTGDPDCRRGSLSALRHIVGRLIANRCEGDAAEEVMGSSLADRPIVHPPQRPPAGGDA